MTIQLPAVPAREDLSLVIKWIEESSRILESYFNIGQDGVKLKPLYVEPKKPREGYIVFVAPSADPAHWDPAGDDAGGFFGYYSGSWHKLG